jgi:hypothetical protein
MAASRSSVGLPSSKGRRNQYQDYWPFFKDTRYGMRPTNPILELVTVGLTAVFVTKPQNQAAFPEATDNFRAALEALPDCAPAAVRKGSYSEHDFTIVIIKNNCR